MKGSFVCPGFDNDSSFEFDPRSDFSQFLEEAKRNGIQHKENQTTKKSTQSQQVFMNEEVKKTKKSWKNVLFPFWRSSSKDKSKKHSKETSRIVPGPHSKARSSVSGPVYGSKGSSGRYGNRLLGSGPLTGLFRVDKREGNEVVPYVSLDKLNRPIIDTTVYGPVYLVS